MKLLSDATRLRILLLLAKKELCVCQIMGVLGISQPLISRNLSILGSAGLVKERKQGKLVFYSLNASLQNSYRQVIDLLQEISADEDMFIRDLGSLRECEEFQLKAGKCDMETFRAFMAKKTADGGRQKQRRD